MSSMDQVETSSPAFPMSIRGHEKAKCPECEGGLFVIWQHDLKMETEPRALKIASILEKKVAKMSNQIPRRPVLRAGLQVRELMIPVATSAAFLCDVTEVDTDNENSFLSILERKSSSCTFLRKEFC